MKKKQPNWRLKEEMMLEAINSIQVEIKDGVLLVEMEAVEVGHHTTDHPIPIWWREIMAEDDNLIILIRI